MNSKIQNIFRYQIISKYGLEDSLYLNESAGSGGEFNNKAKNITYRAISYFEKSGNQEAAQEFSKKANSIWNSANLPKVKILKVCRMLMRLGLESEQINSILGSERCDGVLYYTAYKDGRTKLFAHTLSKETGGDQYSQTYGQAALSGAKGSERASDFIITKEGIDLIKKYEGGFLAKSYKDTTGRSIGYGHFITKSDPQWLQAKYYGGTITQQQAEQIMESDLQKIGKAVAGQFRKHIRGPLSQASGYPQAFIDMVISIAYNAGAGGMSKSPMFKKLITAPYDDSTKMINLDYLRNKVLPLFPKSCNKGLAGIVKRRKAEADYVIQRVFKS